MKLAVLLLLCATTIFAQKTSPQKATSKEALLKLSYETLDSLMYLEYEKETFDEAIIYRQASCEKAKKEFGIQDARYASYLGDLGFLYSLIGKHETSLKLQIQAKSILEKVQEKETEDYAMMLNNLGALHEEMGNYELALSLMLQAKDIQGRVLGLEHSDYAMSLNNIAVLYQDMEQYDLALPLYIEAKNIQEKTLGVEHPDYASALSNLAYLYQQMGEFELELSLHLQAKDIRKKTLGVEHPDYGLSLSNLATVYTRTQNYEAALPLFIESKNIKEKVYGVEHSLFAFSVNHLANLYLKMGKKELAWQTINQAIKASSFLDISINISPLWADSLLRAEYASNAHIEQLITSLGVCYLLLEENADSHSKKNQNILTDLATALLRKLQNKHSSDSDKLRMLAQSNDWLLKSLRILDKTTQAEKAFALADQNKSVLLFQATKAEQTYRMGDLPDSLVLLDKKLLQQKDALDAQLLEKRPEEEKNMIRATLNQVHQNMEDFRTMIEKKYPKYAQLKHQQIDIKVKDIQSLLDEKTVLLEYVIADSVVHIFCIDKNNTTWVEKKIDKTFLYNRIKTLHKVLSSYQLITNNPETSYQKYTESAFWFYQNLVAPVLSSKQNIKNLIIVADGELAHLPFEAFLVEKAPQTHTDYGKLHYLVNDYMISYDYSATLFVDAMRNAAEKKLNKNPNSSVKNTGQILAMAANYETKLNPALAEQRLPADQNTREKLNPLPAARKEIEALQAAFSGFFAFDNQASEKIFKEKAGDYAIIHLAMHGLLDSKRPILSSLAFTEDSDSLENNFCQAHEISKMKLNADLVVLSACETGYGKFEKGNGIASLARAFMYAGAYSLIVSLWQVNDYATSEIMKNLYQNLASGMEKDEALQQAKIQYIKNGKGVLVHPAFWSPFILMGNTDAIVVEKRRAFSVLWVGIGISVVVLGGIAFAMKRKKE